MATGFLQINGSGPRNAAVGVFDKDDNLIAECQSDGRGFWSISSVPMAVGSHQIRAKMRTESGREHASNLIDVTVDDPDADVDISAEVLDPSLVAAMQEIEAEEQEKAALRAAFVEYDALVAQGVAKQEINDGLLNQVLTATGGNWDAFWSEVGEQRHKQKYAHLVCTVAAGGKLEERDQKAVWSEYKKTDEQFMASVERAIRSAGVGWNSSLVETEN